MTDRPGLPALLRWAVRLVVPAHRLDDVLGDLEESAALRAERLGAGAARRHVWRELLALLVWRLGWRGRRDPTRPTGAMTTTTMTKRRSTMGRDLLQDLAFGLRALTRRPAFAATAS